MAGGLEIEPLAAEAGQLAADAEAGALAALAASARRLAEEGSLGPALGDLVAATAEAAGATLVIARTVAPGGHDLVARAVHADSVAVAAELEGTRLPVAAVGADELELDLRGNGEVPDTIRRAAARAHAEIVRIYPVRADGTTIATLELYGTRTERSSAEPALARLGAAHIGFGARLERAVAAPSAGGERANRMLELLGEALAAGADETETAEHIVRLAAEATGAAGSSLWRLEADAPPALLARHGLGARTGDLSPPVEDLHAAARERRPLFAPALGSPATVATVALGEPPVGALQLHFDDRSPSEDDLALLSPFAARAALALRRSRRVELIGTALRRSQTVIGVVSQAIARLSLAHTLETAVDRIAELTASGHVAVYLREGERLTSAAARGLGGSHTELAERLLELALGPYRGRGFLFIEDMSRDPRLRGLEDALAESRIRRAIVIPLIVHDEVTGALGVFKTRPRPYREGEEGLLLALSSQLAVAVQNARLHERTKELGSGLEQALVSERRAARQLRGLYEISQSFAESLSLQATLDALVRTMVELFDLDAAAIRMPDERGERLEARAVYVADANLREVASALLARPQPMSAPLANRLLRSAEPVVLAPGLATDADAHGLLDPFLQQGSSAAVLPLATPGELLGTLTLLTLDPERPLERETVDAAMTVAHQAALAIDNARLYQQQKDFAEMMQRSLLPTELPAVPGLEVGHVYESSARVDVGGDVYDFVLLDDGRLAVVLGDVTGKGIGAAADMAMAKFSFRALARKNPEPSDLLASANEVVVEEIGPGKFITMLCVLVDPQAREVTCASAGHPPARVLHSSGAVSPLAAGGLALGIESGEEYPAKRERLRRGSTVVLFTDGVIEARRDGELYGEDRLDAFLAQATGLSAQALAEGIVEDCRAFAGGELDDDCAVVCLRLAR